MHETTLSDSQQAWLRLSSIPRVTPGQWLSLLARFKISASELISGQWRCADDGVRTQVQAQLALQQPEVVSRCTDWLAASEQHHLLTPDDARYPMMLQALQSPPLALYVTGAVERLAQPQIALVGSRRASAQGLEMATDFASQLAASGWCVTSGLATGIDGAAHRGALGQGGRTVAVTGAGPDIIYPRRHQRLHEQIVMEGGAVATEFWPGSAPRAAHFPQRNRLIAALSHAIVVVEATFKSGTLITANLATNLGRDVFAIPGNIYNPLTAGCHHLLKQGAILASQASDILAELPPLVADTRVKSTSESKKSQGECLATDKLLASVNYDVTSVDIICKRSDQPVSHVLASLLQYELRGLVAAVPGGYIKLRGK